jgi:DNA invertase Pin-like site-specific DNA recombinase
MDISKPMTAAIYSRISTTGHGQSLENQTAPLIEYVKARGLAFTESYSDSGISGTVQSRPGLERLLIDARRGRFKVLVVIEISRLARDVRHLLNFLHDLTELGVSVVSLREGLDFAGAFGKAMVAIIGALVQVERDLLSERIKTALAVKKQAAISSGSNWKCGRPAIDTDVRTAVIKLHGEGLSIRAIAKKLGLGKTTVERIIKSACPKTSSQNNVPKLSLNRTEAG